MSRTYKRVTRDERKDGIKGRRSCFKPEISYIQGYVSVKEFTHFLEEGLSDYEIVEEKNVDDLLTQFEGQGVFYLDNDIDYRQRYGRKNHPVQTVPKIDWHYERWRNGRKSFRVVPTVDAVHLREKSNAVNERIDLSLKNGKNPFRGNSYDHCRYSWRD